MSDMAEAIRQLILEKGYSEDSVKQIIEKAGHFTKGYEKEFKEILKYI